MSSPKILYVITSLRTGGAERLVTDLSKKFTVQGHNVEILVFDGTPTPLMKEVEDIGIKIHKGPEGLIHIYNPINILKIKKLTVSNKYDIIHSHNSTAQLFTSLAGINGISKLVTTEHNTTNRRRNWPFIKSFEKLIYKNYNAVVSVSNQVKTSLFNHLDISEKSVISDNEYPVIYNGVDLSKFGKFQDKSNKLEAKKSLQSPKHEIGRNVILMVAAFRKQKDHATAIKAMRYLDHTYVLWLAGDGKTKKDCEILARNLKINDKIRFLGEIKDVSSLISQAKIVILSTHYEGMPLAAIEAMASGKPFIGSNVDGIKEIVGEEGILFQKGNESDLARKIKNLIDLPEAYNYAARNCVRRAMKFDINDTARQYMELYSRLLTCETSYNSLNSDKNEK